MEFIKRYKNHIKTISILVECILIILLAKTIFDMSSRIEYLESAIPSGFIANVDELATKTDIEDLKTEIESAKNTVTEIESKTEELTDGLSNSESKINDAEEKIQEANDSVQRVCNQLESVYC